MDEALARRTQARIAREIEADGTPVVGAHFAGLSFSRILPAASSREAAVSKPASKLTTAGLTDLDKKIDTDKQDASAVAKAWLQSNNLM